MRQYNLQNAWERLRQTGLCCVRRDGALVYARSVNGRFEYRTHDNFSVLISRNGSIWGKVLPYCIFNTFITVAIYLLKNRNIVDLSFNDQGHTFMGSLVSFLVVTRSTIAYKRYGQASTLIVKLMQSCRELVQHAVAFSRYDSSPSAQKWRMEIARRIIVMLRSIVFVMQYDGDREKVYYNHALMNSEKEAVAISVGKANERTPLVLVIFLRSTIASHVKCLEKPLDVNEELQLLTNVSDFIKSYQNLMKLSLTPFPFPLVQMTRTMLFAWIFTIPCALIYDMKSLFWAGIVVFFLTFGFLGLEVLSIQMDDPFGEDPIDFDFLAQAKVVFDDVYINIHDVDGNEAKIALQKKTESELSKEIKREVRGHARTFSRVHTWKTPLPQSSSALDSSDHDLEQGETTTGVPPPQVPQTTSSSYFKRVDVHRKTKPNPNVENLENTETQYDSYQKSAPL